MTQNMPISEQWERKALEAVDAEAAAQILEETKSAVLSQLMLQQGDMPVSRAEMIVKASKDWDAFVRAMVNARTRANKLRVERDYLRMKFSEWVAQDANHRAAARL